MSDTPELSTLDPREALRFRGVALEEFGFQMPIG